MKRLKTSIPILLLIIMLLNSRVFSQGESGKVRGFLIDSQPQGATVHIENEIIGKTPYWFPYELSGRYKIWAEKRGYENWSRSIEFGKRPLNSISFSLSAKDRRKAALRSMLIPGWGQFYSEQKTKGKAFLTLQVAALVSAGFAQSNYNRRVEDYNHSVDEYQRLSRSFATEPEAWNDVSRAHNELDNARHFRQVLFFSAVAVYAANVLDAFFLFPDNLLQIEILGLPLAKPEISFNGNKITLSWAL